MRPTTAFASLNDLKLLIQNQRKFEHPSDARLSGSLTTSGQSGLDCGPYDRREVSHLACARHRILLQARSVP